MKEEIKAYLFVSGQSRIAGYLAKEIEDGNSALEEHILKSKKTLDDCWKYVNQKAKKMAIDGCAFIDDSTVYEWVLSYYFADGEPADMEKPGVKPAKKGDVKKDAKAKGKLAEPEEKKESESENVEPEAIPGQIEMTLPAISESELNNEAEIENAGPIEPAKDVTPENPEDLCCVICGKSIKDAFPGKSVDILRKWISGWEAKYGKGKVFCCKEHMDEYLNALDSEVKL